MFLFRFTTYLPIIFIPTKYGFLLTPPMSPRAQMLGTYEEPVSSILKDWLKHSQLFIDIGAHVGYYTLLASKYVKYVIAFEPNPFNYKFLKINIRLNKLKNVLALNFAVSDFNGKAHLHIPRQRGRAITDESIINSKGEVEVRVVRLDDFITKLILKDAVIKIDAEGSELKILYGSFKILKDYTRFLMIEIHSNFDKIKIKNYLKNLNYKIIQIGKFFLCEKYDR